MSMGMLPHHFICDHTHLGEFSKIQKEFLEQLYFWPFELIHLGVFLLPFEFEFEFHLIFFDGCKVNLILAHYLTEGSDKFPLKKGMEHFPRKKIKLPFESVTRASYFLEKT